MRKFFSVIMIIFIIFVMFAGCNSQEKKEAATSGATTAKQTTQEETQTDPAKKHYVSGNPLEMTIHMLSWRHIAFSNNWPVWKKGAELTNISLKGTVPSTASDTQEVFNIMIASGEIPDIVCDVRNNFNEYGQEGAFIPLNDLIDQYAPNLKAFLESNDYVRRYATAPDGNIYFIPYVMEGATAEGWFIRKDWLDKLSLSVPTNIDELYNVLKAFREKDPNGNGKKDEAPFFDPDQRNGVLSLLGLFGITRFTIADENGKIFYGRYCDEYKEAMITIARWYKEGLIDQEIFTRGWEARDIAFANDIGGLVHYWIGSTIGYNQKMAPYNPDFKLIAMAPPANKNGEIKEYTARDVVTDEGYGWAISSKNKHPVETIKYFDFWWTEEGRRLVNFGIEGQQYDMVDGKPVFKDSVLNNPGKTVDEQLNDIGAQLNFGFQMDYDYEIQWQTPEARSVIEMYTENNWIVPPFPKIILNDEEQSIYDRIAEPIFTYTNEMTQRWISGNKPVEDTWNEYVKHLKELEIDEFLRIQQSAYDRYMSQ